MPSNDLKNTRSVLLAGASGLVGRELLALASESTDYTQVHSLVRRSTGSPQAKVREHVVNFDALPTLPPVDDVLIALGTTIKVAGSQAAFRRVDHDYVVAVARAGLAGGATRLGLVSAVGADASSRVFYNRVKGEAERDVVELGFDSVVIAQPSLLLGNRAALGQPARPGEWWAERLLVPLSGLLPASFRPVHASDVAAALLAAVAAAEPGVRRLSSRELSAR
ncbi:MAG: hypothetical protein K0R38_7541 [Polyangiaceae bacterium]|jgi:uncharacterized protein YbjT (DUF2867 family)|nr:hypothetical protein [Polyangiaceae bacterium]